MIRRKRTYKPKRVYTITARRGANVITAGRTGSLRNALSITHGWYRHRPDMDVEITWEKR